MTHLHLVQDEVSDDPIGYLLTKFEAAGGGRVGMAAVYEFSRLAAFHLLDLDRQERYEEERARD